MSGIFDQTQTSLGIPWNPLQQPTLTGVDYIGNLLSQGAWTGPYTAGISDYQTGGISQGADASMLASGLANQFQQYGSQLAPGLTQAFNYYQGAMNGGTQNPWLTNTNQYLGLAGQIADNPYLNSQITAALRDPYRDLMENTMPGISLAGNMAGQAGGSQEAVLRAIAERGYADRAADVGAQMRGAAWNQGLGIADQSAGNDYLLAQNAANNLSQLGGQGLGLMGKAYEARQGGASDLFNWGTQQQSLGNQQLQGQMQQFYAPWELAKSYGSYINPLAGSLKEQTLDQNQMSQFLLSSLSPILAQGGAAAGEWLFGGNGTQGQFGKVVGDVWDWTKDRFGL